jgi:hypothetical protein
MNNLLTGIYSLYNASTALKAALPGKLHLELAPPGTAMTYAVYSVITGRPDYMLGNILDEILWIQFDIYAATNALRLTAYNALIAVYDDARPAATGYVPVIMERTNQQLLRDGDQNEIYRAIIEYDARWSKGA